MNPSVEQDDDEEQATAVFQVPGDLLASLRQVSAEASSKVNGEEAAKPVEASPAADEQDGALAPPVYFADDAFEPSFGIDVPSTPVVMGLSLVLTALVWALLTW